MHRILFLFVLSLPLTARAACPDLSAYSPGAQPDWTELEQQLAALLPECLESSEYFALFGAAQLNSGRLAD